MSPLNSTITEEDVGKSSIRSATTTRTQPLHITSATSQIPEEEEEDILTMPPSSNRRILSSPHMFNGGGVIVVEQESISSSTASTPDNFRKKCTPLTAHLTPDYDIIDSDTTSVAKQLASILAASPKDGTTSSSLDASSTEPADSSKSSEYEMMSEDVLQLHFDRHCDSISASTSRDPSPDSLLSETIKQQQQAQNSTATIYTEVVPTSTPAITSRTLFSLEDDLNDDDDNDEVDTSISLPHQSAIAMNTSSCFNGTSPNHSFERGVYSDGDGSVSPIHESPPSNYHQYQQQRRSLTTNGFRYSTNDTFVSPPVADLRTQQIRSRRSLLPASATIITPTTISSDRISNGAHRNNKKKNRTTARKIDQNNHLVVVDNGDDDVFYPTMNGNNHRFHNDCDDCFSSDIDTIDHDHDADCDDYSNVDQMNKETHPNIAIQQQQHPIRLSSMSSTNSSTKPKRRKSSSPSKHNASVFFLNDWKSLSHRLTSTQSLLWMLTFVGLTSITMIITMNHQMMQFSEMEQQNHLSVLFKNNPSSRSMSFQNNMRGGFVLPHPKNLRSIVQSISSSKVTKEASNDKPQILRGKKPTKGSVGLTNMKRINSTSPDTPVQVEGSTSKSKPRSRTVNLNTLAQHVPHDNIALGNLLGSNHVVPKQKASSSSHHHHSTTSHGHHSNDHRHDRKDDKHHHKQNHHSHSDHKIPHHDHNHKVHDHHRSNPMEVVVPQSSTTDQANEGIDESNDTTARSESSNDHDDGSHEDHHHSRHVHHHSHHEKDLERLYKRPKPSNSMIQGWYALPKVAVPEIWDDDAVIAKSFDSIDYAVYDVKDTTNSNPQLQPRVVYIDGSFFDPVHDRVVRRHRTEITDSTQLYSITDSQDEPVASTMERRAPFVQGECVPMQEWQTTFNPSCNGMHELDMASMGDNRMEDDFKLFGMNGFWRNAWRYDSTGGHNSLAERDTVVLKTLRINHRFEDAYFENHRIDAVVLERLTASPHVINVFGFCGHSVLTEFADGKRLGELADKMAKVPLARLQIARDIANGLADVHGIDGDGNATFVHLDINPANVVSIGGTLKLNDFNIGVLRRWNTTSNTPCGIPAKYPNPQWRSPEEARLEQNLTEKVDVFSLGHIFFRLICGHEPWHKLEPGGMPSKEELNEKVRMGNLPTIPMEILNSVDPEIVAIRDAMLRCYTYDPIHRPSARDVAIYLQDALNVLESNVSNTDTSQMVVDE